MLNALVPLCALAAAESGQNLKLPLTARRDSAWAAQEPASYCCQSPFHETCHEKPTVP